MKNYTIWGELPDLKKDVPSEAACLLEYAHFYTLSSNICTILKLYSSAVSPSLIKFNMYNEKGKDI